MSQRDHGLVESVTAVPTPTSPRKRQKTGKEDDCDSKHDVASKHAMSTASADDNPAPSTTPSPDNKVQMTIRSQPQLDIKPSNPSTPPLYASSPIVSVEATMLIQEDAAVPGASRGAVGGADGAADSPPVIAIDDDDDDDDDDSHVEIMAECAATDSIQIEIDPEDLFCQFPYTTNGNYLAAIRSVVQHLQAGVAIEPSVIPQITLWLNSFSDYPSLRKSIYTDRAPFWDEFHTVANRIIGRRAALGEAFCEGEESRFSEEEIIVAFLTAYLRCCTQLFQADADLLERWTASEPFPYPIVSYKHMRLVHLLLRPERSHIFHLLAKEYGTDIQDMGRRLLRTFIQVDGPKHLFRFAEHACGKLPVLIHNNIALIVPQICDSVGWALYGGPDPAYFMDMTGFYREMLCFFRRYNYDLQNPSKVADTGQTREIINNFSNLLFNLCQWDQTIAGELIEDIWDFGDPESPTTASSPVDHGQINKDVYYRDPGLWPALVKHAWKFKLLRKYVVKGRMELRVMSIGAMDTALVEIWREYNDLPGSVNHPVMQYLADFLLHERVVNYIISVDSHPQIISRSGNIVGFLVVTSRYSESQTDAIWNTVSNSSDPRVVSATMTMLRSIINLMSETDQLHLLTKMHDLPIESYTLEILRFMREILSRLTNVDWTKTDMKARPWNVYVRILQDTPPAKDTGNLLMALHTEAAEQLHSVSRPGCFEPDERYEMYRQCAAHIASRSSKASGSVHAIFIILEATNVKDASFFEENPEVTRKILEETCSFIRSEKDIAFDTPQAFAVRYRLDLLSLLINRATKAIPSDMYRELWDHLVGEYAQTRHLRDLAWSRFSMAMKNRPDNEFCKQLISDYVPHLDPQYYTGGLYEFVASYKFPTTRKTVETPDGTKELLQIRGADLLWSMTLSAPTPFIADRTATLLAHRYLEVGYAHGIKLQEVEEAHVALVEQCTKELLSTYRLLRGQALEDDGEMDVVLDDSMKPRKEQQFTRTVLFLKLLLGLIRGKVEFTRTQRSDSKVEFMDEELPVGKVVEIRYQIPSGKQQSIIVGLDNTLSDMSRRLCQATGFSKINIFSKGKRLDVAGQGAQKIANLDLIAQHLLVQNAGGSEVNISATDTSGPCSVFETALLSRFEELFACMDSDDLISETLHGLFLTFPFPERIAESIVAGTSSAKDLFPVDKPYQANYACHAINHALDQQLHANTLNEKYLVNGVRLLDEVLLNTTLSENSTPMQVDLTNTLIFVFVKFLKVLERPSTEASASYFSDKKLLVTRLVDIMFVNLLKEPVNNALCPYAAIVEASLHSRGIWHAFTDHPKTPALHKALLLDSPNAELRAEAAKIMSSVCGGALSPSSALTETDTATCFWKMISSVVPHSITHPDYSEQLFELADQIFRKMDEHHRDEATLRSYLTDWSELLLNYNHIEVVGRENTDFVVLGLAKLLLSCISSLKSFKKPLNSGQLIEKIWNKFLFIPRVVNVDEQSADIQIPILESKTRKELFDLILALAEDRASYKCLIQLCDDLAFDEKHMAMQSFDIDRKEAIRSPTGYLGLNNPRAICYMNSLLAQLFMNVNFRKFMLGIDIADPNVSQRLLQETQKLFAKMQNSYRKWADPQAFAACVRVPDGESIDINIQMDADEFYNLLFDQWEAQMISPEIKQQFRSFYGGQTVNQIKSKECEHVSERLESFFVVQCDVQGKSNLNESLQAFVEGDVMEGENKYKCESCGGKLVDAVKRTCLKDVPDNLIFHLKRFDFDLVNLSRAKINDQFDFPMSIDVSPYKIDHLSDPSKPCEEDMFDLVGVLVHQGSSEAGHYYSYIRSRPTEGAQQWCEFNDRDVDAFDPQYIPIRTFGGLVDQYQRQLKNYSAYMLFYQRRSAIAKDRSEYSDSLRSGNVKVPVPASLSEEINEDNDNCIREYSLYDPYHTKFVRQVLANARKVNHGTCSEDHELETNALQIVLEHLFQIHVRIRTPDNFEETLLQVRKSALSCAACCESVLRWLVSDENALLNMLINCEDAKARAQSRALLIDCLRYLSEQDPAAYGLDSMEPDSDSELPVSGQSILPAIVEQLRKVAENSWLSIRSWDDFYLTLCQISDMGHIETGAILNEEFLEFCLQIFCMTASPHLQQLYPDMWRVTEKRRRIYNRMIEFVYLLLSKIDLGTDTTAQSRSMVCSRLENYDRSTGLFATSEGEVRWLHYWYDDNRAYAALDRMLETFDVTKTEKFYPGEILKRMMEFADADIHHRLYVTVIEGILQLAPPSSDPYVRAALSFCESSLEVARVDQVIAVVAGVAGKSDKYGGEALFYFIAGLLHAENEEVTISKGRDYFFLHSLLATKKVAIPLLIYDNETVRRLSAKHFEELFAKWGDGQDMEPEIVRTKYKVIRYLADSLMRRIQDEHQVGTSRSYMQPMIATCGTLIQQLRLLHENDDPSFADLKHSADAQLLQYYASIESRLGSWSFDDGSPQSVAEGFDQSDYGTRLNFFAKKLTHAELAEYFHSGSESGSLPD